MNAAEINAKTAKALDSISPYIELAQKELNRGATSAELGMSPDFYMMKYRLRLALKMLDDAEQDAAYAWNEWNSEQAELLKAKELADRCFAALSTPATVFEARTAQGLVASL